PATESVEIEDITLDIDQSRITLPGETEAPSETISEIEKSALQQNVAFENTVAEMEANHTLSLPNEIQQLVKTYSIKTIFKEQALQIILPQFYLNVPVNNLFGQDEEEVALEKENLLEGFPLGKSDTNINFD